MATTADKIVLDTKDLCLLCFADVTTPGDNHQATLKMFLRYLNVDIFESKKFELSILSVNCLDNDYRTVSLCRECATTIDKFSEMYATWEKIKQEMDDCVLLIRKQMLISDGYPVKMDEYQRKMKRGTHWKEVLFESVVADLRKQTLDNCSRRINSANFQNCPSLSVSSARSTLNLKSFVTNVPTTLHPPSQIVGDESNSQDLHTSTQLTTHNQSVENEQPFSKRGSGGSSRDSPHEPAQLKTDSLTEEVAVEIDCFSPLPDTDSEPEVDEESSNCGRHEGMLTRPKSFKCKLCQRTFSQNYALVKHMQTHSGEKPFRCNVCQKTFSDPSNCRRHMKLHTGVKSYKCELCQRTFSKSNTLVRHLKIHTGEKPYQCTV